MRAVNLAIGVVALLAASSASAQDTAWQACALEGETCTPPFFPVEVRYGEPWTGKWTAPRTISIPIECSNAVFGDPSPGTGKRCEWRITGPVADLRVTWQHATQNEDGSALVGRTGYRVERATQETGPWSEAGRTESNTLTFSVPAGRSCVRVFTLASNVESAPTPVVCAEKQPPVIITLPSAPKSITIEFID